jgi:two-component system, OmpR family, sensor kinase
MPLSRARARRGHARPSARRLSVRVRIVVSILAVTAFGLAASGVASYLVQRERVLSGVDDQLLHSVSELKMIAAGQTSASPPASVEALLRVAMQQMIPAANESVVGFIDGSPALVPAANLPFRIDRDDALVRRITAEAHPTRVVIGTARTTGGSAQQPGEGTRQPSHQGGQETLRYLIIPVSVANDPSTGLYVAAYDLKAEMASVADSFRVYTNVAIIALLLVGSVAWHVAGRLLRPIRLLRDAAAGSSTVELTERVPVTGRDDVSELAEALNGMFDRLQESSLSQRRLLDDIGHELKTPLTIIRGHLELLDSQNTRDVEATRALTIDELDRMSTLVSEISLLAESQSPQFIERVEIDIEAFTASVGAKASVLDPERAWEVRSAAGIAVMDARRITQAWLQLAGNAAKYATPGTPVVIASEVIEARARSWLSLSVSDSGPGIPTEARARIFERFARLESTRGAEGSGLGLAIVSAIAETHGGSVTLTDGPSGGSNFTIRIPLTGELQAETDEPQRSRAERPSTVSGERRSRKSRSRKKGEA